MTYSLGLLPVRAILVGILVLVVRLLTLPRTPWDAEEVLGDWFLALVTASVAASVVTAVALALAFRNMSGDEDTGAIAALLFSFSAAALVHAPTARPDSLALMFVALALLALTKNQAALFGVCVSAATACQPEMAPAMMAMLFAALILVWRDRRSRVLAGVIFAMTLIAVGAPELGGYRPGALGLGVFVRYLLHPWGSKLVTLPLLILVALGIRALVRKWTPAMEVMLWMAFVHVAFGIAVVDPANGARWALPSLMFTALLVAAGLRSLSVPWIGATAIAALSLWYVLPILRERTTRPSPPVAAARAIPQGVLLHERETQPFVPGGRSIPLEMGLHLYLDQPEVPLTLFANGNSNASGARVFARGNDEAYGKLTRNAYRHVSLIPIPPEERYAPWRGTHGLERNEAGESWRWLEKEAEIRLPKAPASSVRVELRLPPYVPFDTNEVSVNGTMTTVRSGSTTVIDVPWSERLLIRSSRAFALADVVDVPDTRRVAVQLMKVQRR